MRFWRATKENPAPKLQQKQFQLAQDGVLEVPLHVVVFEVEEIKNVRSFEDQGRPDLSPGMQGGQFFLRQLVRFSGQSRSLIEHGVNPAPESANAPTLNAGHLGVELTLERLIERQELPEMRPA